MWIGIIRLEHFVRAPAQGTTPDEKSGFHSSSVNGRNRLLKANQPYNKPEMSNYSLEAGETVWHITCKCCGRMKNRVIGFVCKNGRGHARYYALLNVEEKRPRVGLTLSVGPWSDRSARSDRTPTLESELPRRSWVHLDVSSESDGMHIDIRDPKTSPHYPWEKGGTPLTPEQTKVGSAISEIWSVADFVINTDPAISSYLGGQGVDAVGREVQHGVHPARSC